MYTISMLNMKGGVGKTTTSINLATGLAMKGQRTLLVDLDPQSNTTSIFTDGTPEATTSDVLKGNVQARDAVLPVDDSLWLMPSELALATTDTDLRIQTNAPQHNRLHKALLSVQDQFDYCIVDCPPIINLLTVNAIMASNLIVVPIKPDRFALDGFAVTMRNITQIRENWELDLDFKVLFTIVNRNNEERDIIMQLREAAPGKAFTTEIRCQPKPIAGASARREAVIKKTDPRIGVADDLRRLVDEVLEG